MSVTNATLQVSSHSLSDTMELPSSPTPSVSVEIPFAKVSKNFSITSPMFPKTVFENPVPDDLR
jgi:hypothetical protein